MPALSEVIRSQNCDRQQSRFRLVGRRRRSARRTGRSSSWPGRSVSSKARISGSSLTQCFIDQHTLGRFRISVTRKAGGVQASPLPPEIEAVLAMPREWWNAPQRSRSGSITWPATPSLQTQHDRSWRPCGRASRLPTTTLVLEERSAGPADSRTFTSAATGTNLARQSRRACRRCCRPLPQDQPANRLTLAKWIVDRAEPADRPRHHEPRLARIFRPRDRRDSGRFRDAGGQAFSSRAARLAGDRVRA